MILLVIQLAIIGFLVYLLTTYIPMAAPIKQAIIVIVVICIVIYVLRLMGAGDMAIPRL